MGARTPVSCVLMLTVSLCPFWAFILELQTSVNPAPLPGLHSGPAERDMVTVSGGISRLGPACCLPAMTRQIEITPSALLLIESYIGERHGQGRSWRSCLTLPLTIKFMFLTLPGCSWGPEEQTGLVSPHPRPPVGWKRGKRMRESGETGVLHSQQLLFYP